MEEIKETKPEQKSSYFVPVAIVIAGLLIAGAVFLSPNSDGKPKTNTGTDTGTTSDEEQGPQDVSISVDLNGWSSLGNQDSSVVMVEYADYACSFCARFKEETFPLIKKDYIDTGKVRFVYKDFAVVGGEKAAEATHCAAEQNKFWEYHDILFAKQSEDRASWQDPQTYKKYANQLSLDADAFVSCFDNNKYQLKVQTSTAEAIQNGGQGTPYFLINDTPISGAQPYSVFQTAIDAQLAQ